MMFCIPFPSFDQTGSILNNKDYTSKFLLNISSQHMPEVLNFILNLVSMEHNVIY